MQVLPYLYGRVEQKKAADSLHHRCAVLGSCATAANLTTAFVLTLPSHAYTCVLPGARGRGARAAGAGGECAAGGSGCIP